MSFSMPGSARLVSRTTRPGLRVNDTRLSTVTRRPSSRILNALTLTTLGLAPINGYVTNLSSNLAKVAPLLLVAVWAIRRCTSTPGVRLHYISWQVIALLAVVLCSAALNTANPFLLGYVVRWVPFLVLVVVLVDVLSREVRPLAAAQAIASGAVVAAGGAVFSFVVQGDYRATGPLTDPNDLAYVLVSALPIVLLARESATLSRRQMLVRAAGSILLVIGAALTLSRGAGFAVGALAVWAVVQRLIPAKALLIGLVSVALFAVSVSVAANTLIHTAVQQKEFIAADNVNTRELRWEAAGRDLAARPFFGYGPGGARWQYASASHNAELDEQTPVTHNMYLEVAAELGGTGLLLFVGLIISAFVATSRIRGPDQHVALAVQGSLLAACIASFFLSEEYYMTLWFAVAAPAAMAIRHRGRSLS